MPNAYLVGNNPVVDTNGQIIPGQYTNRASLSQSALPGYISYLASENEFIANKNKDAAAGQAGIPNSGIYWHKFLTKPVNYMNETIIEQGILSGGYGGGGGYNQTGRMQFASDVAQPMNANLPFGTKYGSSHQTQYYQYTHGGEADVTTVKGSSKQSFVTYSITSLTTRPNIPGGYHISTQPGPVASNLYGIVQRDAGCYITFSTDTWATAYNPPVATGAGSYNGWGTIGENNGYIFQPTAGW